MSLERKKSWLLLEWVGTVIFGALPDWAPVNRTLSRLFYFFYNGYTFPNLSAPRYFNEKLIVLKNSQEARDPLRARVTDKELVKHFVAEKLGPGHVVPTLAVLRRPDEVDSFQFPLPCVVKPTHSSQEVMHFADRQPTDEERRRLRYWLRKNYFAASREPNYRDLEKKLIVEPVIGGEFGAVEDIKILCFHGQPKLIQVDHGRYLEHRRDYFDAKGRRLAVSMRKPAADRPLPNAEKLPELLEIAARLSAGFTFIRVDFYVVGRRVLIGELTSFPTNCTVPFRPLAADLVIARLFDEPTLEFFPALSEDADVVAFPRAPTPQPAAEARAPDAEVVAFPSPAATDPTASAGATASEGLARRTGGG